ncbi:MAG: hypothetical protein LBC93_00620 [Synergistaceae bacterium]|nr:hypothetical protein [Synergistaceae bacterium]
MTYRRGLAAAFLAGLLAGSAHAADLPAKVGEWRGTPPRVTEFTLTQNNENVGTWKNRVYTRAAPLASVEANLMEGPGPGTFFVPENGVPQGPANGPLGPPPAYEVLNIAGKHAILENEEATGQALAVALGKDRTLTLETKNLSREELLSFARELITILEEYL